MSLEALKDNILPSVFNKDGTKFVECKIDSEYAGKDQFQSNVVFLTAVVQTNGEKVQIPLVVKFEPFKVETREMLKTNLQFYNEVIMYSQILPFLNKKDICEELFAKFYYGVGTIDDPDSDVVIIEDLRPRGYKLAKEKGFIDYDHLTLAMGELGRFHALSYEAKKETPDQFYKLVRSLKETSWFEEVSGIHPMISSCFHRAIDPLIKQGKHVEVLQRLLDRVDDNVGKFVRELVAVEEPLAVVCHGDFCRNNMLFKYDQGKPTHVMLFDIATSRYSSPVVDIAFFLFLNSSREVRQAHWDDLLTVYHKALASAITGVNVPSLIDIQKELLQKAVYGFVHCSFFLPMMLYENEIQNLDDMADAPLEEMGLIHIRIGGEEGTKLLSDMVEELVDRGCLTLQHKFLQPVKSSTGSQ